MKTAEDMTKEMQSVLEKLKTGEIEPKTASQMTNCVGKMIGLTRVQLDYQVRRKEKPNITFLNQKPAPQRL